MSVMRAVTHDYTGLDLFLGCRRKAQNRLGLVSRSHVSCIAVGRKFCGPVVDVRDDALRQVSLILFYNKNTIYGDEHPHNWPSFTLVSFVVINS